MAGNKNSGRRAGDGTGNRGGGRRKEPTSLRILKGTANEAEVANEIMPRVEKDPQAPEWLRSDAKDAWALLSKELTALRLLTSLDRQMFGRYCEFFVQWLRARDFIESNGTSYAIYEWIPRRDDEGKVIKDSSGEPLKVRRLKYMNPFPEVALFKTLAKELRSIEEQFGMSPSARARIATFLSQNDRPVDAGATNAPSRFDYGAPKRA
jgi:P27 family predicted phage terminase small subunit